MKKPFPLLIALLALTMAAALLAGCGAASKSSANSTSSQGGTTGITESSADINADLNSPAQQVLNKVYSSVVNITVTASVAGQTGQGVGSGIVYTSDGLILTNDHVVTLDSQVSTGQTIAVAFSDGKVVSATIVAENVARDIAAIRVNRKGLSPVTFGNSANVKLAQWAIVIGSPLNFQNSISLGIVSGLNRTLDTGGGQTLTGLLQVDAAISPGNSGGGCFDARGNFIGMPEVYLPPGQTGAENIGFAIPSDVVHQVAKALTGR